MTTFDKRDKNFENKYAHDEEMVFRMHARIKKLAGLWAATLMGIKGTEAEAYANELAQLHMHSDSPQFLEKLEKDFATANIIVPVKDIRIEIARQADIARVQIFGDAK